MLTGNSTYDWYSFLGHVTYNGLGEMSGSMEVAAQGVSGYTYATSIAGAAIGAAALSGPVDIIVNSGGSQVLQSVLQTSQYASNIRSVTYVDPISLDYPALFPNIKAVVGSGLSGNYLTTNLLVNIPAGAPVTYDSCGHDIDCHFRVSGNGLFAQSVGGRA